MKRQFVGIFLLSSASLTQAAEPGTGYLGVMLHKFTYEESGTINGDSSSLESEPEAAAFRVGYRLSQYASIEARYGAGTSDDAVEIDDRDYGIDMSVDSYYGGYIRVHLPNSTAVSPYFIAGYTKAKMELEGVVEADDDASDLSTGIGIDITLGIAVATFEYLQFVDKNDGEADALSLGIAFTF